MRKEIEILTFCSRQVRFVQLLSKLHIIKPTYTAYIPNPLTGNPETKIQGCLVFGFLENIIQKIDFKLEDESGRIRRERLIQYGNLIPK